MSIAEQFEIEVPPCCDGFDPDHPNYLAIEEVFRRSYATATDEAVEITNNVTEDSDTLADIAAEAKSERYAYRDSGGVICPVELARLRGRHQAFAVYLAAWKVVDDGQHMLLAGYRKQVKEFNQATITRDPIGPPLPQLLTLKWPEPQPLPDVLPPVALFNPKILPNSVRAFVVDVAERMQCPLDFPAVAMMIVLAGVLGRKIGVRPKRRDDWTVIANLWGVVVGRPGLMKTPAISEPMKFLKRLEIEAKQHYDEAQADYLAGEMVSKAAKQVAEQAIKKAIKDGADANEIARNALAEESEQPARRRYQLNDSTVEKLGEILNENPNGVTLVRDELYAFLKSLDKDGHESARGFYLEAWNGNGRYSYDRIMRGTIDIDAACVSMIGTIQPSRLAEYVSGAVRGGSGDDGLIQRFQLTVWPECPTRWQNVDRWPDGEAKRIAYDVVCRLDKLVAADVGAIQGEEDDTPYLRFDPDAQATFNEWHLQLENRLRGEDLAPAIESHLAKYRSLIPSLALLVHLADGGAAEIPASALNKAIQWGEYLESHAHRVYASAVHSDITAARCLAKKILDGSLVDGFTVRDVYRSGWSGLSNSEEAQTAIEVLIDLDWLELAEIPTGGRKRTEHKINPKIHEQPPGDALTKLTKGTSVSSVSTHLEGSQDF